MISHLDFEGEIPENKKRMHNLKTEQLKIQRKLICKKKVHIEHLAGTATIESFVLTSENKAHTGTGPSFATAYKSNKKMKELQQGKKLERKHPKKEEHAHLIMHFSRC